MIELFESVATKNSAFQNELVHLDYMTISTLGPKGTSSDITANFLAHEIQKINSSCDVEITLQPNFDLVFQDLLDENVVYALIPTAYEKVTDFFWCSRFCNVLNFIFKTPEYGLIAPKNFSASYIDRIRLATCPAVENMIYYNDLGIPKDVEIEIVHTHSTAEAANFVCYGYADVGITNVTSFSEYNNGNIKFISKLYQAEILWTLFRRK